MREFLSQELKVPENAEVWKGRQMKETNLSFSFLVFVRFSQAETQIKKKNGTR